MTITTRLFTFFHGRLVGEDQFGNRYFTHKGAPEKGLTDARKHKRWVIYNGRAEPSKVPAEWHGWLHYTLEAPPTERNLTRYGWQSESLPNLTGTKGAYLPPGHINKGGHRANATADYDAWKP